MLSSNLRKCAACKVFCKISKLEFFLFGICSCNQAVLWMIQSICPSVCLSVSHNFLTMFPSSYHPEIFRSDCQWQKWRPYKRSRSKVKVTEVNTQLSRFWTVTPVWIHIWWWNDAQSLMLLRRGALLFLAATKQLYKWYFPSVRPSVRLSVRLSVCHTFLIMFPSSYHHEIFRSYYQWPK